MFKTSSLAIAATALIAAAGTAAAQTNPPPATSTEGASVMPTPIKSGYAPTNGVSVYYAVYGKGDPVVLLHGGMVSMEVFGPILDKLAANHTVIGIDFL